MPKLNVLWWFGITTLIGIQASCLAARMLPSIPIGEIGICYFVDANCGQDNWSGKVMAPMADGRDGPLRTIQAGYDCLRPGDTLYIREGLYRQTVKIYKAGSEFAPIVVKAFPGDEGRVILSGADMVTNWYRCTDPCSCCGNPNWRNIYYADLDMDVRQLFQNGIRLRPSRYPEHGWLYPTSVLPNEWRTVFYNVKLGLPDGYLDGSTCNIRTAAWHIDKIDVVRYTASDGKVRLASPTRYAVGPGSGHYFTNLISQINQAGEWAFDRIRKRLYLWPVGGSVENVEVTVRECGIDVLRGGAHHTIEGIWVRYPDYGIRLSGTSHITINSSSVDYCFYIGIQAHEAAHSSIRNNAIRYSGYMGIAEDGLCSNGVLEGNYVYTTGAGAVGEDPVNGDAIGIGVLGRGTRVVGNVVDRSAYNGLYAGRGDTTGREIAYNLITNSCLSLADGAGIYTDGYSGSTQADIFHHNIVADTWGWLGGWARIENSPTVLGEGYGVYIDEQANRRVFEFNTIMHCSAAGLFIHWAKNNRIANNTFYGSGTTQVLMSGRDDPRFVLRGNDLKGNLLIANGAYQKTLSIRLDYNDLNFGLSSANRYYHPTDTRHIWVCTAPNSSDWQGYTLRQWQSLSGNDIDSVDISAFSGGTQARLTPIIITNPSMVTAIVDLEDREYRDVNDYPVTGSVSLGPFESMVLIPQP